MRELTPSSSVFQGNKKMKIILMILLTMLPLPVLASDMAGVGLFVIVIDVSILIVVAIIISILFRSKKALYGLYGLDLLAVLQSVVVFSYNWKLNSDIFMRNILIFQLLILCFITVLYIKRVKKYEN